MFSTILRTLTLGALAAVAVYAADVAGKWSAQVPAREGQTRDATFNFKVDGEKLTGTMSGQQGDIEITDGKVSGDTISFTVTTQRGAQKYTGKVEGATIKFTREGGQGPAREFVAKRPTT